MVILYLFVVQFDQYLCKAAHNTSCITIIYDCHCIFSMPPHEMWETKLSGGRLKCKIMSNNVWIKAHPQPERLLMFVNSKHSNMLMKTFSLKLPTRSRESGLEYYYVKQGHARGFNCPTEKTFRSFNSAGAASQVSFDILQYY